MKKSIFLSVLLLGAGAWERGYAQTPFISTAYAYFGEAPPGATPKLFASGHISDGMANRDMAVSPSGDELFYTIQSVRGQVSCILYAHFTGGAWSDPEVADFSGSYSDLEAAFSPDGTTVYFSSNRPVGAGPGSGLAPGSVGSVSSAMAVMPKDFDIWTVKKDKNGKWAGPLRLDTVINSTRDEFYPSIARNGNLYFTREMENGKGKEDIVMSEWKNGRYQEPHSLPEAINSDKYEFNAFVDPDEHFLLFTSFGRADDLGGGDLYVSFKNVKGEWMPAAHLDSTINTRSIEFCPFVSPDKKYLFFTSGQPLFAPPFEKPLKFRLLQQLLQGPGNGLTDIYWMDWQTIVKKYSHGS
ncbi:MAG TPA: hypothetical protein VK563_16875 [Puia sp.]|nr:hypothetical protein [Puia sp.]